MISTTPRSPAERCEATTSSSKRTSPVCGEITRGRTMANDFLAIINSVATANRCGCRQIRYCDDWHYNFLTPRSALQSRPTFRMSAPRTPVQCRDSFLVDAANGFVDGWRGSILKHQDPIQALGRGCFIPASVKFARDPISTEEVPIAVGFQSLG